MAKYEGKLGQAANFFIKHAVAIFVVATVVCLLLVASLTNTLKPDVIGVWLVVGILTSLLFSGVALVVVLAVAAVDKARHLRVITYEDNKAASLRDRFEQEKIAVGDFASPLFRVNDNKRFEHCEVHGPGSLLLQDGCTLEGNTLHLCDVVVVKAGVRTNTAAAFRNTTFRNCRFVSLVIYMPDTMAAQWLEARSGATADEFSLVGRPA